MNYVLDDKGNKVEALSKEETLAVMQQAIDNGSLAGIDKGSAFVSKLKCCVSGGTFLIAFATQAKYNELKKNNQLVLNCLYIITDDETEASLEANIESLNTDIDGLKGRLDALGFKQGSVILADGITATQNELKRQGNYVLLNLELNGLRNTGSSVILGNLPSDFLPKERIAGIPCMPNFNISSEGEWTQFYCTATCEIKSDGTITVSLYCNNVAGGSGNTTYYTEKIRIRVGYEAEPLTVGDGATSEDNIDDERREETD